MTTATLYAYAMSDMAPSDDGRIPAGVVSVPEPKGCGRQHKAQLDGEGHPYIKCAVCAPWLVGNVHGFAATPNGVPLTPDEMGEVEISKRQGEVSYQLAMKAMGQTMGQLIQQSAGTNPAHYGGAPTAAPPPPLTAGLLKEQLTSMDAAERAEILAMLTGQPITPEPAAVDDLEPRSAEYPVTGPPAKRGPGRPRKNP